MSQRPPSLRAEPAADPYGVPYGVVPLDIAAFRAAWPQFADPGETPDAAIEAAWRMAGLLAGNRPGGRIPYAPPEVETRAVVMDLVLCHLLTLRQRGGGGLVGTLTSATEGMVSAGSTFTQAKSSRWWEQTQCGATAWELMLPYRSGGLWIGGGCRC